jgi:ABC-type nitrate/sulfonate/bicarbonate transport system substrate-binding protein
VLKAVAAGTLDAGLGDVDVFDQQRKFGVHALSDGMLWKEIPEYTNQASYASDDAIQNHREALVRLLAAFGKAYRFISGPESRAAYISAWHEIAGKPDSAEAITQWNWIQKNQPYDLNLLLSDQQIDYVQQANVEFGAQTEILSVSDVADMSIARDALKLLA